MKLAAASRRCDAMLMTARHIIWVFNIITLVFATDLYNSDLEKIINNYTKPKNISDDEIIIKEASFVNDNELKGKDEAAILRMRPKYFHPSEKELNLKAIDMMRQSLYATQDRMRAMDPILSRLKDDPSLRMAFIFNRLKQLIIDMRRIYTLALKWRLKKRVFEQVTWYTHCTRKYVDVLYVVQHVIELHTHYAKLLKNEETPQMPGMKP